MRASPARAGMYRAFKSLFFGPPRFPRTRGDVPRAGWASLPGRPLPPHARGCTPRGGRRSPSMTASPARAGMYRRRSPSRCAPPRFPRTRGDVPYRDSAKVLETRLPPHARGCTPRLELAHRPSPASPARAGMYPRPRPRTARRRRFPRTRGDVPANRSSSALSAPLPPHARGCTPLLVGEENRLFASPARAGMYPVRDRSDSALAGFPRTRGDVPPRVISRL